jgi:hypothetical protein
MSSFVNNKNYLMLCTIHHPYIHGKDELSDPNIETHYLVYDRFEPWSGISYLSLDEEYDTNEEYDSDDENPNHIDKLSNALRFLREQHSMSILQQAAAYHPTIRNFRNIISKSDYIKPEIGQYIILPTQEAIAILKTFWLRIIQRKWKKIFTERQRVNSLRNQPFYLHYRQANGKWPESCNYLPGLDGMLQDL